MPTRAATTVKSGVSRGALTYDRGVARAGSPGARKSVALRTGRLPKLRQYRSKALAALFGRSEHIERGASRGKQHDVARYRESPRAMDGLFHRVRFHRR